MGVYMCIHTLFHTRIYMYRARALSLSHAYLGAGQLLAFRSLSTPRICAPQVTLISRYEDTPAICSYTSLSTPSLYIYVCMYTYILLVNAVDDRTDGIYVTWLDECAS